MFFILVISAGGIANHYVTCIADGKDSAQGLDSPAGNDHTVARKIAPKHPAGEYVCIFYSLYSLTLLVVYVAIAGLSLQKEIKQEACERECQKQ